MFGFHREFAVVAAGVLALAAPASASSYYVKDHLSSNDPLVISGGLQADGPTGTDTQYDKDTVSIGAGADLGTGVLQGHLVSRTADAILGLSSEFGDRVTIIGGAGTEVTFNFLVDYAVNATADALGGTPALLTALSRFAVFDPSQGATSANWASLAFPLLGSDRSLGSGKANFGYHGDAFLEPISDVGSRMLSVTLPLLSDIQSFDFFAGLTSTLLAGDNALDVDIAFSSFASLDLADGVTISSASGAFLTEGPNAAPQVVSPVPLPASALLLLGALGLLGWGAHRKMPRA